MKIKFKDMDGVEEVTVTQIHVKVGQDVKKGDDIVDIEADKASDTIKSAFDGKVAKINCQAGDTIKSGDVIVELGEENTLTAEVVANKPSIEVKSNLSSDTRLDIDKKASNNKVLATPVVRRMAHDSPIDISTIKGTGPLGRVLKQDLLNAEAKVALSSSQSATAITPASTNTNVNMINVAPINVAKIASFGNVEHIPLSNIRKAIANQMSTSLFTAPHVSLMVDINGENLVQLRASLKEAALKDPDGATKLTYMPFFIKAVAKALKEERFKFINSTLNLANNEILVKKYYNIGIAADTDKGLVVPVIKNADKLSLFETARTVNTLADKARSGNLKADDMQGGTFTITNFGSAGLKYGTPIINYPEVAILGIGAIELKPVIIEGKIVFQHFFPMSISIDHRVIDGAPAGNFMQKLKELLENPTLILT